MKEKAADCPSIPSTQQHSNIPWGTKNASKTAPHSKAPSWSSTRGGGGGSSKVTPCGVLQRPLLFLVARFLHQGRHFTLRQAGKTRPFIGSRAPLLTEGPLAPSSANGQTGLGRPGVRQGACVPAQEQAEWVLNGEAEVAAWPGSRCLCGDPPQKYPVSRHVAVCTAISPLSPEPLLQPLLRPLSRPPVTAFCNRFYTRHGCFFCPPPPRGGLKGGSNDPPPQTFVPPSRCPALSMLMDTNCIALRLTGS